MNTSKPIATISFNTESFLFSKCNELVDNHVISFYAYIKHYGEPDENKDTLKDHFHLYLEPNKRIDTMNIRTEFKESLSTGELPLGCLPFSYSKFDDWYFYILHDPLYLARKGMSRHYSYSQRDIITSDKEYLIEKINGIDTFEFNHYIDISDYQDRGYSFQQYVVAKNINPMQIKAYFTAWEIVSDIRLSTAHKKASDESHLLMDKLI